LSNIDGALPESLEGTLFSAAVLQSDRGKRLKIGGGRQNVKVQNPNDKWE
jgi:hypothetical protein